MDEARALLTADWRQNERDDAIHTGQAFLIFNGHTHEVVARFQILPMDTDVEIVRDVTHRAVGRTHSSPLEDGSGPMDDGSGW